MLQSFTQVARACLAGPQSGWHAQLRANGSARGPVCTPLTVIAMAGSFLFIVGGCGSSNSATTRAAAITRGIAYADAVNLRASDLPGFVPTGESSPNGGMLGQCDTAVVRQRGIVQIGSQTFERPQLRTSASTSFVPLAAALSEVRVTQNTAQAMHEMASIVATIHRHTAMGCLERVLKNARANIAEEGTRGGKPSGGAIFDRVEVLPRRSLLSGVQVYGISVSADLVLSLRSPTLGANYFADEFVFAIRSSIVMLECVGSTRESANTTSRRLIILLYRRAKNALSAPV